MYMQTLTFILLYVRTWQLLFFCTCTLVSCQASLFPEFQLERLICGVTLSIYSHVRILSESGMKHISRNLFSKSLAFPALYQIFAVKSYLSTQHEWIFSVSGANLASQKYSGIAPGRIFKRRKSTVTGACVHFVGILLI